MLVSGTTTPYPLLNLSIQVLAFLRQQIVPLVAPVLAVLALSCLVLPLPETRRRQFIDVMVCLITLRLLMLFCVLNLMIFLPPADPVLLFAQLLLFLRCLPEVWGWIYWRVDTYAVTTGKGRIFASSTSADEIPPADDYFLASFTSVLTQTLDNFNAKTRFGRTLIFVHGLMVWDIMALALSRAIALAAV